MSRSSLWTFLDCENLDKTRAYLERSKSSPLEMRIWTGGTKARYDAFLLTIPHINRLKILSIAGFDKDILKFTDQLCSPAPLLEELEVRVERDAIRLKPTLFAETLPSLCALRLTGTLSFVPWKNLGNLTTLNIRSGGYHTASVTELLDIFERAPLLYEVKLLQILPWPPGSDVPDGRVVSLPCLQSLRIFDEVTPPTLLNHLHIPTGALLTLESWIKHQSPSIPDYLPRSLDNLDNISNIISIDLDFRGGVTLRLKASRGGVYVMGAWKGSDPYPVGHHYTLRSLSTLPISSTGRFVIAKYLASGRPNTERTVAYQTLLRMENLRTPTLACCTNRPFILALNPGQNTSNTVVCPELEELILFVLRDEDELCVDELLEMVEGRSSRGAKLPTIVIVNWEGRVSPKEALRLGGCASHVEYKLFHTTPIWNVLPGETKVELFDW